MNATTIIVTILICITAITIVAMLQRHPFHIKIEKVIPPAPQFIKKPTEAISEETLKELNAEPFVISKQSMDSVISAANKLMGIEIIEEDNNGRKN